MDAKRLLLTVVAWGGVFADPRSVLGQNWMLTSAPITNWSCIAMSADGTRCVAGVRDGLLYRTTNLGATWLATSAPSTNWSVVASSADGNKLAALASEGGLGSTVPCSVFSSTNAGASWRE